MQEKTAHAPRADRQVGLGRIAGIERDRLDRLQAVRIMIARPDPGQRNSRFVDDRALGCEQLSGLDIRRVGAVVMRETSSSGNASRPRLMTRAEDFCSACANSGTISSSRARVHATYQSRSRSRIRLSSSFSSGARSSGGTTSPITQCSVSSSISCERDLSAIRGKIDGIEADAISREEMNVKSRWLLDRLVPLRPCSATPR